MHELPESVKAAFEHNTIKLRACYKGNVSDGSAPDAGKVQEVFVAFKGPFSKFEKEATFQEFVKDNDYVTVKKAQHCVSRPDGTEKSKASRLSCTDGFVLEGYKF